MRYHRSKEREESANTRATTKGGQPGCGGGPDEWGLHDHLPKSRNIYGPINTARRSAGILDTTGRRTSREHCERVPVCEAPPAEGARRQRLYQSKRQGTRLEVGRTGEDPTNSARRAHLRRTSAGLKERRRRAPSSKTSPTKMAKESTSARGQTGRRSATSTSITMGLRY